MGQMAVAILATSISLEQRLTRKWWTHRVVGMRALPGSAMERRLLGGTKLMVAILATPSLEQRLTKKWWTHRVARPRALPCSATDPRSHGVMLSVVVILLLRKAVVSKDIITAALGKIRLLRQAPGVLTSLPM